MMGKLSIVIVIALGGLVSSCGGTSCKTDKDCPSNAFCDLTVNDGACKTRNPKTPTTPTCIQGGTLSCPSGSQFYSSPTASGCFTTGNAPPNPNPDPGYDNPSGPCSSVGDPPDSVTQCNAGCSFCLSSAANLPPGCHVCTTADPC